MLAEPDRTNYDLKFSLFGFRVRVHPLFWLAMAIFGASALDNLGVLFWLAWIVVAFVSILVHEMGHALAYRWFGTRSHIVLYSFGGLAIPWSEVNRRWKQILISLAGPGAGFLLCGAVFVSEELVPWAGTTRITAFLYGTLILVNLLWGCVNLFPVFPLDGGRVSQEVCLSLSPRKGLQISLQISMLVGGLLCVYSIVCALDARGGGRLDWVPWWARGSWWTALLFGVLAYQSYQLLQLQTRNQGYWSDNDDLPPWRR